jgi:hypothetical protein
LQIVSSGTAVNVDAAATIPNTNPNNDRSGRLRMYWDSLLAKIAVISSTMDYLNDQNVFDTFAATNARMRAILYVRFLLPPHALLTIPFPAAAKWTELG